MELHRLSAKKIPENVKLVEIYRLDIADFIMGI